MLWKKTGRFWKGGLAAISFLLIFGSSGCGNSPSEDRQADEITDQVQAVESSREDEEIIAICQELYQKAAEEHKTDDLETIRRIVNRFGEKGYPAVDSRNQIDMENAEQVVQFCKKAEAREEAEVTIIKVGDSLDFIKYDLQGEEGNLNVTRSYYKYESGKVQNQSTESYQADHWDYTREGYLIFSGIWFSEEQYVLTVSGVEEHAALRVQPLDETCRELGRKYFQPVSYDHNNLFLVDWSENDHGELNFYDLFDLFYSKVNGKDVPYIPDENMGVGAVYQIPKEEFEHVIMWYFRIDSETLQSKTIYDSESGTYEYKPRGFHEVEYPEYPYSEVIGYTQNSDGIMTLRANVVYPYGGNSKVYAHEVVVRPSEDGGVQYVSNKIIPSEDNGRVTWHTPRLTEEEWQAIYEE